MAMHCPRCLTEYRDGFSECADCRVPLAQGVPPAPAGDEHEVQLVTVFETSDPFAVSLAKATLEDTGIEFVQLGDDSDERNLSGMTSAGAQATRFQVEASLAEQAREVLESLANPQATAASDTEETPAP